MKIQDRYRQGLIASWRSKRRTVDAEIVSVIPRAVSSTASSCNRDKSNVTGQLVWLACQLDWG
ncbi:MAG: hypothetical protein ACRDVE_00915, partial [Actinocrinis sp.]